MENFTPGSGFVGGLLIGGAASLFVLLNGRVAGVSGILSGLIGSPKHDRAWRLAFVAGIVLGPLVLAALGGALPEVELQAPLPILLLAGLLVGFGTQLGSGCTSGHGICGIARGSPRSIAATAVFFAVAAATVFVMRHVIGG
jgi:uncharacterized membrane protein YedE/YeeE